MFCLPIGETNGNFFFFLFSSTFAKLCYSSVIIYTKAHFWYTSRAYMIFARPRSGLCTCVRANTRTAGEYIALVLSRMHDARSLWRTGSQQSRHKLFNNRSGPMSLCNRLPRNLQLNPPGKITVTITGARMRLV